MDPVFSTYTKVVGVTRKNEDDEPIQELLEDMDTSWELSFERDYANEYDDNAIKVYAEGSHIGYLSRQLAEELSPKIDDCYSLFGEITEITGGGDKNYGCNIRIWLQQTVEPETLARIRATIAEGKLSSPDAAPTPSKNKGLGWIIAAIVMIILALIFIITGAEFETIGGSILMFVLFLGMGCKKLKEKRS